MPKPIEESIAQSKSPRISDYFSQGFNIVFKAPALFVIATVVFFVITIGLSYIPFLGSIANSLIVQPLLLMGFFIAADRINHLESIEFATFFEGFKFDVGRVIIANLLMSLLIFIPLILIVTSLFYMVGLEFFTAIFEERVEDIVFPEISGGLALIALVGFLGVIYLSLSYMFVLHMLRFKNLGAWDSLEASRKFVGKHFGGFILFLLFAILVNMAGALLLGIGLLVTIPATYCALYVAFDDMIGARNLDEQDKIMDHFIA